ncbi:UNVERIFIED_CONTAM: hypothetical protein HDU68_009827 [Siphonaria sp. JEL0065]|nr:hypothetical protein HDU68_009827 [Siphonaria sp. JEL0065]
MHCSQLLLLALLGIAQAALVNVNVLRTLDTTGNGIVRSRVGAKVSNIGSKAASVYRVAVPLAEAAHVASVSVGLKGGNKAFAVRSAKDEGAFALFDAELTAPIAPGATAVVDVLIVYTQLIRPLPKVIDQRDEQFLLFPFNAYWDSPYETTKQKTSVRLNSPDTIVPPKGPEPFAKKGSIVTYGPYENVKAFESAPVSLHYKDNKPILVAATLSRELELSHWGSNLAVTEYYDLHHRGAALRDKLFSRVDFQFAQHTRGQRSNLLEEFRITLPPKSANVYYRDDIGNVSTSHFRKSFTRDSILDVKPRYPLYGGWKYNWHHTYDVPLNDYLKKDSVTGRYVFNVKFIGSLSNVTIEDARLRVALPEGALNVKVDLPFKADSETHSVWHTNLDSIGRPLVIIQKNNVADEYAVDVQISYDYPSTELYRKPLVVSTAFFGLLLLGLVYARLDFSLVRDPTAASAETVLPTQRTEVTKLIALAKTAFHATDASFEKFRNQKSTEGEKEFVESRKEQSEKLDRVYVRLGKVKTVLGPIKGTSDFVKGVEEIEKGFKERFTRVSVFQDAVVAFLKELSAAGGKVDEKKKSALQEKVIANDKFKKESDADLTRVFESLEV